MINFESYEDFKEKFKIIVPENFNFAFDVVDVYAEEYPEKVALVWCNDHEEEKILTFKKLKHLSDKAANLFRKCGIKKGDAVMLNLKSHWEFWVCMVALNKISAISIPSTHMLKQKDFVFVHVKAADSLGEDGKWRSLIPCCSAAIQRATGGSAGPLPFPERCCSDARREH
jgi:acetyl-CoA synthetase